jgi:hypothetical protein
MSDQISSRQETLPSYSVPNTNYDAGAPGLCPFVFYMHEYIVSLTPSIVQLLNLMIHSQRFQGMF